MPDFSWEIGQAQRLLTLIASGGLKERATLEAGV